MILFSNRVILFSLMKSYVLKIYLRDTLSKSLAKVPLALFRNAETRLP